MFKRRSGGKRLSLLVVLSWLLFNFVQVKAQSLEGKSINEAFEGVTINLPSGANQSLSSYLEAISGGQPVVLITYYSFCKYCAQSITATQRDLDAGEANAKLVSLLLGDIRDVGESKQGFASLAEYETFVDEKSFGNYNIYCKDGSYEEKVLDGAGSTPDTYVMYKGKIYFHELGYIHSKVMVHDDVVIDAIKSLTSTEMVSGHYKTTSMEQQYECGFMKGMRHGTWKSTIDGKTRWVRNYRNGTLHGEFLRYYENGNLEYHLEFTSGKQDTEFKHYYESGQLDIVIEKTETQTELYSYKVYYEDGKVMKSGFVDKDRKVQGMLTKYHSNGSIASQNRYKDDLLDGKSIVFHENGEMKEMGDYVKDLANGTWNIYHTNGQLYQVRKWENGKFMEIVSCYDSKGNQLDKGTLKNGNGTVNFYDENNNLTNTVTYEDGYRKEE